MAEPQRNPHEFAEWAIKHRGSVSGVGEVVLAEAYLALEEQYEDLLRQRVELQNSIGGNIVTIDKLCEEKAELGHELTRTKEQLQATQRELYDWRQLLEGLPSSEAQLERKLLTERQRSRELQEQKETRERDFDRVLYLAEHLWQMIPQEVWREHGAEWMGQYEGDYHAQKVRDELADFRASVVPNPASEPKEDA